MPSSTGEIHVKFFHLHLITWLYLQKSNEVDGDSDGFSIKDAETDWAQLQGY